MFYFYMCVKIEVEYFKIINMFVISHENKKNQFDSCLSKHCNC